MKMSWIRSSKGTTLAVLLLVSVAAVGTAAAVSVSATSAPEEARVGEEVTVSVTLTDLYSENSDWTLEGSTELRNVTGWEVTKIQPNGNTNTETFSGQQSFSTQIASAENLERVNLTITGDVPPIEEHSFRPPQSFVGADLDRVVGENTNNIEQVTVVHYTNRSRAVRNSILQAEQAVNGSNSDQARSRLNASIQAYNDESFDSANTSAADALDTAQNAQESQETTQLLLYAGGAVVLLLLIGGGVYYWRSQQDDYDKLR